MMTRKKKTAAPPPDPPEPAPVYRARLSQVDLLEAVQRLLRERSEIPPDEIGLFKYRFGMVGNPMITLVGEATELPDAGDLYLDWSFESLPNVAMLPKK